VSDGGGSGFVWVKPPSDLGKAVQDYADKVEAALYAIASKWGQDAQDAARQQAPWEDRSGNARSGIFFAVEGLGLGTMIGEVSAEAKALMKDVKVESAEGRGVIVVVSHTVFYGKYLETARGGKHAIIMSTIEANLPKLENLVSEIFR
jgi:hypothetical protein